MRARTYVRRRKGERSRVKKGGFALAGRRTHMNENARLAALVRDTQVFLLDMDGTVYIGDSLIG